jgi:hypothetical protein
MPRRKPLGWPKLMVAKRLKGGNIAYYWRPPTWAKRNGCPMRGEASLGTAAMIAFYWLQRETDILNRLSWGHYRPADAPGIARIFHHKTGELIDIPLFDDDGTPLWPELTSRLDAAPRRGTLITHGRACRGARHSRRADKPAWQGRRCARVRPHPDDL